MTSNIKIRDIQSYIKLFIWIIVIAYLCFSSGENISHLKINTLIPVWLQPHIDKVVHFTMFFVLAFLINSLHWQATISRKQFYIYLCIGTMYAASTEIVQKYFIPTRSGDIIDFAADIVGISLSVMVFPYWPKSIKWFFG